MILQYSFINNLKFFGHYLCIILFRNSNFTEFFGCILSVALDIISYMFRLNFHIYIYDSNSQPLDEMIKKILCDAKRLGIQNSNSVVHEHQK